MKYRGPNFYPPEGHDWIPTDAVRRLEVHNQAQLDEQYAHDVAAFRGRFFGLMLQHCALDEDGFGWAVFDDSCPSNVVEQGSREVLLMSKQIKPRIDAPLSGVPMVRIITNEPFVARDSRTPQSERATESSLSEEVTVLPDAKACYLMSAASFTSEDNAAEVEQVIKTSASPMFIVRDGKLQITMNLQPTTPLLLVADYSVNKIAAKPFGDLESLSDMHYALEKASDIVASIADITPQWHSDP